MFTCYKPALRKDIKKNYNFFLCCCDFELC